MANFLAIIQGPDFLISSLLSIKNTRGLAVLTAKTTLTLIERHLNVERTKDADC